MSRTERIQVTEEMVGSVQGGDGRAWKQEDGERQETSSPFTLADTRLTEEDSTVIRGWVITRLLPADFQLQHKQIIAPHCPPPTVESGVHRARETCALPKRDTALIIQVQ